MPQDIAMFDKHTHTLIAQRLDQAEKQREQIRAISLDYPEITIEDAYAVQREWVRLENRRRSHAERPQNRPDLESDAGKLADQRTGLRRAAG
ncbi:2-oxo-hepta-3-ene-1,7-dioic acid hydratase (OHEDhydratase) [Escherichia coli TA144]|nr:2-oxo-hepta-3-ene-1,7-dioic acid hydratase (OHEDhydratase) [Escherichia coli TA144]